MRSWLWVVASCAAAALACGVADRGAEQATPAGPHRVRATPEAARSLVARGATVLGDYGAFVVLDAPAGTLAAGEPGVELRDGDLRILLNSGPLDTTSVGAKALAAAPPSDPAARALHLVQFSGPIRPEWRAALEARGLRVVSYVPSDAYLVYGPAAALDALPAALGPRALQFRTSYGAALKLDASLAGDPGAYSVQLVEDPEANPATLALAASLARAAPRVDRALGYVNLVLEADRAAVEQLAERPDVVSVLAWSEPRLRDERQDMVVAGALKGGAPSGPGYLDWLAAKGFTQAQFDASGFGVDVSDSGVDNGTDQPDHFGLYRLGDATGASRVAYVRLEGTPHGGSRLQGCDGHGTVNAHIVGGWSSASGFPFADAQGFRYGLGVAPFVRIGSSVIFDPWMFTSPDYEDLQSRAYAAGMRVSTNSWGSSQPAAYDSQSQRYDALVRDAQPDSAAVPAPGNQEMVIVFAAGNDGPAATTLGSPGNAKNVISVGAAEGVQAFGGQDGCRMSDAEADSAMDVADFSSRGPSSDGRARPDLLAPGTHVSGGVAQAPGQRGPSPAEPLGKAITCFNGLGVCGGPGTSFFPDGQQWYTASSGTSHSTPAVAGAAALLRQWFLNHGLRAPSPAMTKAYLVHGARYMTGAGAGDTLPSFQQGMGLLDLGAAFDGTPRLLRDQEPDDLFTHSGEVRTFTGWVADPTKPVRVSLAFTDVPGPTFGAAWVNDLDLTLEIAGRSYKGNVFSGATSIEGGSADPKNNVESVFLPPGLSGPITVTVTAANLAGDGVPGNDAPLDQDFALVAGNWCANAPPPPPGSASARPSGDNALWVTWAAAPGATRYQIYRGPSAGGPWTLVTTTAGSSFLDLNRSGGSTYHYAIRAGGSCAFSEPTQASATATGPCTQPPTFAGLASAESAGRITCGIQLAWEPATPGCGGEIRYEVYRGAPGFTPGPENLQYTFSGTYSLDAGGLTSGTAYAYVVRAVEAVPGRGLVSDGNAVARIARPFFGGGVRDDFDAVRPPAASAWWSTQSDGFAIPVQLVSGCHYQSASTAWRFGAADAACGGHYPSSAQSRLVLGGADGLTVVAPGTTLSFRLWYSTERGYDGGWLEYSTVGPEGPFQPVPDAAPAASGVPYITAGGYDATLVATGARAWTGSSTPANGNLLPVTVNLDGLLDRTAWFAWSFRSDSVIEYEGLYLDDVAVNGPADSCSPELVPPGPPIRYRITLNPVALHAGEDDIVVVEALDRYGQVSAGYSGIAAVTSSDPRATLPESVTFSGGSTSFLVQPRTAGLQTLTVKDATANVEATRSLSVSPAVPAALQLAWEPTAVIAGAALAPAPAVTVTDAYGNRVGAGGATVRLTLAGGPMDAAGAVLSGTTAVAESDGQATFPAVWAERAGAGYRLVASAPGLFSAESGAFTVLAASPRLLELVEQPEAARAGEPFSPALRFRAVDEYGNPSRDPVPVRLAVASGPGTIRGVDSTDTDPELATFEASFLDVAGAYTLTATSDGLEAAITGPIAVRAGAPRSVEIVQQPVSAQAGLPLSPPLQVQLRDAYGNACDDASGPELHLEISAGATASASASTGLLGDTTASPEGGVARFPVLAFDRPGTYELLVGATGIDGVVSGSISVERGPVAGYRVEGPAKLGAGEAATYLAIPIDGAGATVPDYLGQLAVTSTDSAAALPDHRLAVQGGTSEPIPVVFHTGGRQVLTVSDAADSTVSTTFTVEVRPGGGGGGGGCGSGPAGLESALAAGLALAALLRRRARR
jgi:hypothetical protein